MLSLGDAEFAKDGINVNTAINNIFFMCLLPWGVHYYFLYGAVVVGQSYSPVVSDHVAPLFVVK